MFYSLAALIAATVVALQHDVIGVGADSFVVHLGHDDVTDALTAHMCNVTIDWSSRNETDNVTMTTTPATTTTTLPATTSAPYDVTTTTYDDGGALNLTACDVINGRQVGSVANVASANITINCTLLTSLTEQDARDVIAGLTGTYHNVTFINCHLLYDVIDDEDTEVNVTVYGARLLHFIKDGANGNRHGAVATSRERGGRNGFRCWIRIHYEVFTRPHEMKAFSYFDDPTAEQVTNAAARGFTRASETGLWPWMLTIVYVK